MVDIAFSGLLSQGLRGFGTRITDLETGEIDGDAFLFAAAGSTAGVSSYSIGSNGRVSLVDQAVYANGTGAFGEAEMLFTDAGGTPRLVTALHGENGLQLLDAEETGDFDGPADWVAGGGDADVDILSLACIDNLIIAGKRSGGLSVFRMERDGSVRNLRNAVISLGNLVALEIVEEYEDYYLVGASSTDNTLVSWRLGENGDLTEIGRVGMEDGLGIATPTALTMVTLHGVPYMVVASADSSSLSVLRIHANGQMTATDHVIDDLETRFGGASQVEAIVWGNQTFLAASGADDGLSLFIMLDGGRLLHLDSYEDTTDAPLNNVTALAGLAAGAGLQIYTASETEDQIGAFEVDLGNFGTVQSGTHLADTLMGTTQDDILVAGGGEDLLTGGHGADLFVFEPGDGRDTVSDFHADQDSIDLSLVPMLYSLDQVSVHSTATGALLVFRDMEIELRSHDGQSLSAEDLSIKFAAAHMHTGTVSMRDTTAGQIVNGTDSRDRLEGGDRDDFLRGLGGNDTIVAGAGGDRIDGGDGNDVVNFSEVDGRVLVDIMTDVSNAGFVRFYQYGNASGDTYANIERFVGGSYADNLRGGNADDVLYGEGVSDRLYGRAGDDTLNGGTGADAIYGNRGADQMTGGPDEGRRDRFIFFNESESGVGAGNRDIITDFKPGEDRIELSRIDGDSLTEGKQDIHFIGSNGFTGNAGELRAGMVRSDNITLVQLDLDGDGVADFEIELTGLLTLSANDFLI